MRIFYLFQTVLIISCCIFTAVALYSIQPAYTIRAYNASQSTSQYRKIHLFRQEDKVMYYSQVSSWKSNKLNVISFGGENQCQNASYQLGPFLESIWPVKDGMLMVQHIDNPYNETYYYQIGWWSSCNQSKQIMNCNQRDRCLKLKTHNDFQSLDFTLKYRDEIHFPMWGGGYSSGPSNGYFVWLDNTLKNPVLKEYNFITNTTSQLFKLDQNQSYDEVFYSRDQSQIIVRSYVKKQTQLKSANSDKYLIKNRIDPTKPDIVFSNGFAPCYLNENGYVGRQTFSSKITFVKKDGSAHTICTSLKQLIDTKPDQDKFMASYRVCTQRQVLVVALQDMEKNTTIVQVSDLQGRKLQTWNMDVAIILPYTQAGNPNGMDCNDKVLAILATDGNVRIFNWTDFIPDPQPQPDNHQPFPVWAIVLIIIGGVIAIVILAIVVKDRRKSKSNQNKYQKFNKDKQ